MEWWDRLANPPPDYCLIGRWKNGANKARIVEATRTIIPASADEYQAYSLNGVSGSANAQAMYATVAANISQTGHCENATGTGFCDALIFAAYMSHTTMDVVIKNIQNVSHSAVAGVFGWWSAARIETYNVNISVGT